MYKQGKFDQKEETRREIKELAEDPPLESNERRRGYHQAIEDILKILE